MGGKDEDVDPLADEMRSIKEVRIALLFREKQKNRLRVSLRSKGKINIASVAEKFGGGGHFDAAGCHIENTPLAMKRLIDEARKLIK